MRTILLKSAAFVGLVVAAAPALAEKSESDVMRCSPRAELLNQLEERFGEVFSGQARRDKDGLVELYVGESGSWTILLTRPDGVSCPVAVGNDAEKVFRRKNLMGKPI